MPLIKNIFWFFVDFVVPPRCLMCQTMIVPPGHVCGECWRKLSFISQPFCNQCGFPFEFDMDGEGDCGFCLIHTPPYQRARSALVYDEASKTLILKFKHGDGTYLAPALADWMHQAGVELFKSADFLIPVPLHWQRMVRRRYNQAAMLAQGVAQKTKIPALLNALKRTRNTPSQGHLTQKERAKNVKNAFVLKAKYTPMLKGKNVVLIDDVLTSGSTVEACTRALLDQGVNTVDILTLARVVKARYGEPHGMTGQESFQQRQPVRQG